MTVRACIRSSLHSVRCGQLLRCAHKRIVNRNDVYIERIDMHVLTRLNNIAIQGTPQMAVDKEAICVPRVYSYYFKCNFPLFYV